jgi:ligand-binding sensor domain-containing protein
MQYRYIAFVLILLTPLSIWAQIQPIGQWREHLPWHQAIGVVNTEEHIWAATPYSIFSVDLSENSIERFTKISGLTETGISAIGADQSTQQLIIAYTNSNIDLLKDGAVVNINAIKNSPLSGDKTIYSIFVRNQLAYLSTGIGIVVIDLERHEVRDTYIIGNGGSKLQVNGVTADASFFYAATEEGLKKAAVNNANLADFRNWQIELNGPVQGVVVAQNNVIAKKNDSLFKLNGTAWNFLYHDGWKIKDITVSGDKILLSETQNTSGRIIVLNVAGAVSNTIQDANTTISPRQAIFHQNEYWIADSVAGLSKYTGTSFQPYIPDSPPSIASGGMDAFNKKVYAASGAVNSFWEPTGNKNGVYRFADNQWSFFNARNRPQFDSLPDIMAVLADPLDESIWAGSYGGGLVNIKNDNTITIYKQNSPLQPAYFSSDSYRVSGLARDAENQVWVANYAANTELHVLKTDGNWHSFSIPFPLPERGVSQIVVDDVNQKWIVSPKNGGLVCFNHGQSVDNPGDDQWMWYRSGVGNGNLPDNNVLCIAKDKSNFIWVGTAKGIGIIYCPQQVFVQGGCEAVLPVVQQDNFAGYLFRDEQVQAIAVDGADRKWVGTKNGIWLISADGEKTIYRFTAENSPLPDNDIKQIIIEGQSCELLFSTAKGIVSLRTTATESTTTNSNVLVFPNPVPPGYNGSIAIRGVANNAIVKIAEMDGRLVYQTRALGGQAIWNGKDYKGRTISTGVYLVLVSDDARQENLVTKIVFINK